MEKNIKSQNEKNTNKIKEYINFYLEISLFALLFPPVYKVFKGGSIIRADFPDNFKFILSINKFEMIDMPYLFIELFFLVVVVGLVYFATGEKKL